MKFLRYFLIYLTSKDAETAAKVYNMIYNPEMFRVVKPSQNLSKVSKVEKPTPTTTKPKSKKDEIVESLNYLKSKKNPSKQEKESIYTLEMVLKNMK